MSARIIRAHDFVISGSPVGLADWGFTFTHDGKRYAFNAPDENYERALELIAGDEVDNATFVELNLMFDIEKYVCPYERLGLVNHSLVFAGGSN